MSASGRSISGTRASTAHSSSSIPLDDLPKQEAPCEVVVLSGQGLTRHSLERLLESYCENVSGFPNAEAMFRQAKLAEDIVVILEPEAGRELSVQIDEILSKLQKCKIILLLKDAKEADLITTVRAGVRGCLTQDIQPEIIGHMLAVIRAGHVVWPAINRSAPSFDRRSGDQLDHRNSRRPADVEERLARLSKREKEVLLLVGSGLGNKRIATAMAISDTTVRLHMRSIMKKLGIENRTQAAIFSMHARSLDP